LRVPTRPPAGAPQGTFYENAASLVGVYREKATNSSQVVTLDLEQYARVAEPTPA
jgi:hypothetical protein